MTHTKQAPLLSIERMYHTLSETDLNDLCDATDAAIKAGGGFGWIELPARAILERFWQGVVAMPQRMLFVARLDGVICGACQLVRPAPNNEAQRHTAQLLSLFITPWARGHSLSRMLLKAVERTALEMGHTVINLDLRETQTAAIQLYETEGYTFIGAHPYYARVHGHTISGRYYTKNLIGPENF